MEPTEEFVIWHDVINSSLSPHFNNHDSTLSGPALTDLLKTAFLRSRAIIYCQRTGTSNIHRDLIKAGLPVIHVVKDIASRKVEIDPSLAEKYTRLNQPPLIELKIFNITLRYKGHENQVCKTNFLLSAHRRRNFKKKALAEKLHYPITGNENLKREEINRLSSSNSIPATTLVSRLRILF